MLFLSALHDEQVQPSSFLLYPPFFFTHLLLISCLHCRLLLQCPTKPALDGKLVPVQVFDGESFFYYPRPPASQVEVPLNLKKDAAVNMLVKVSMTPAESCHCCAPGWKGAGVRLRLKVQIMHG